MEPQVDPSTGKLTWVDDSASGGLTFDAEGDKTSLNGTAGGICELTQGSSTTPARCWAVLFRTFFCAFNSAAKQ